MNNKLILLYAIIELSMAFMANENTPLIRRVIRSTSNSSKYIHNENEHFSTQKAEIDFCRNVTIETTTQDIRRRRSLYNSNWTTTTTISSSSDIDISSFSEEFRNCSHTIVEPECYETLPNGSVFVPLYSRSFNTTDYLIREDGILFICPEFFPPVTDNVKFPRALEVLTKVGLSISVVFILLHIIMFIFIRKLRNLPGYSLLSLCSALLMAYIGNFLQYAFAGRIECSWVGMIIFYFYLVSFFWMNAMSYDVWRSLRMATSKLRRTADRPIVVRFALYSVFSWGTPLLILLIAFTVDRTTNNPEYKLIFTDQCWFQYKQALSVYFALPFFVLLFLNIIFYISSFYMISSATMKTAENKTDLWFRFLISMRLAVAMGLMWIFGVLATATQAIVLWYFYIIFNTLQGVFIFFSFSFTEKTRNECRKAIQKKKSSIMPTQTSSQF